MRLLIAAMISTLGLGICSAQNDAPKALDLCTVVLKIQSYHRQHVRITASLGRGGLDLYDPKCNGEEARVTVFYKDGVLKTGESAQELLRITQERNALVTVEGTMYGPEPVSIDPNYPDWLKERLKDSVKRYGHQGSYPMLIEVDKILDAREVDNGLTPKAK
jgi:hypothetical protein